MFSSSAMRLTLLTFIVKCLNSYGMDCYAFDADIHGLSERGDPLTFQLVPSSGERSDQCNNFNAFLTMSLFFLTMSVTAPHSCYCGLMMTLKLGVFHLGENPMGS